MQPGSLFRSGLLVSVMRLVLVTFLSFHTFFQSVTIKIPLCAIAMISLMACSVSGSWCRGGGRGSAARARICRTTSRGGAPSGVGRDDSPSWWYKDFVR